MIHVLIYDIESDRIRTKVAQACEEYGLERVQFSAFWGEMSDNDCEALLLRCQELIADEPARVHILPLCRQCFARRRHWATGVFKGANEAPRDRDAPILFLPDTSAEAPGHEAAPARRRTSPGGVAEARMDAARKLRRDRPVGTTEDPWAECPAQGESDAAT